MKYEMDERAIARFFAKAKLADSVRPGMETPCLEWTAFCDWKGYGRFAPHIKMKSAHRVAWELEHGEIEGGLFVCHRCDNPGCVRVDHLFLGTNRDNVDDSLAKGRTAKGERNGSRTRPDRIARGEEASCVKLTESGVREIFKLRSEGWKTRTLSCRFGVSTTQINRILRGAKWKHLALAGHCATPGCGNVTPTKVRT